MTLMMPIWRAICRSNHVASLWLFFAKMEKRGNIGDDDDHFAAAVGVVPACNQQQVASSFSSMLGCPLYLIR